MKPPAPVWDASDEDVTQAIADGEMTIVEEITLEEFRRRYIEPLAEQNRRRLEENPPEWLTDLSRLQEPPCTKPVR